MHVLHVIHGRNGDRDRYRQTGRQREREVGRGEEHQDSCALPSAIRARDPPDRRTRLRGHPPHTCACTHARARARAETLASPSIASAEPSVPRVIRPVAIIKPQGTSRYARMPLPLPLGGGGAGGGSLLPARTWAQSIARDTRGRLPVYAP